MRDHSPKAAPMSNTHAGLYPLEAIPLRVGYIPKSWPETGDMEHLTFPTNLRTRKTAAITSSL